ncbi:MAG: IS3 family transposase [Gammaproteobacteria bacterium]|nr:IS3 family transposase [Gammaproteobacteria bacterium]
MIHQGSRETYVYPRVYEALKRLKIQCGRNRIARIMREYGIKSKMSRRCRKHRHRHYLIHDPKNLLLNRPPPKVCNEVWVCDVTYIRVADDWNYLCTIMDLYSRKIIGWHFAPRLTKDVAYEALMMALEDNQPGDDAIFHTDRGVEFSTKYLKEALDRHGLRASKGRAGCCWDNAAMESFYHTLKTEMVYFQAFKNLVEAVAYIMDYLRFYNNDRLHSSLQYRSPEEFAKCVA